MLLVLRLGVGGGTVLEVAGIEEERVGVLQRGVGVPRVGDVGPRGPQDHRRWHAEPLVPHLEHPPSRKAAAGRLAVDGDLFEIVPLFDEGLDDGDHLAGDFGPPGMRRERVVDGDDSQAGVTGHRDRADEPRLRAIERVGSAVRINQHPPALLPPLGLDVQDRNAAEPPSLDRRLIFLDDLGIGACPLLFKLGLDLFPTLDVPRLGQLHVASRFRQFGECCLRLGGDGGRGGEVLGESDGCGPCEHQTDDFCGDIHPAIIIGRSPNTSQTGKRGVGCILKRRWQASMRWLR